MPISLRELILAADDIRTEEVQVPEWSCSVLVRGFSGAERDIFESKIIEQHGKKQVLKLDDVRARVVIMSVVDEDGKRVFKNSDLKAVSRKSAVALGRVFKVAQRLSGLTTADVEELTKNLPSGQNADSGSD